MFLGSKDVGSRSKGYSVLNHILSLRKNIRAKCGKSKSMYFGSNNVLDIKGNSVGKNILK